MSDREENLLRIEKARKERELSRAKDEKDGLDDKIDALQDLLGEKERPTALENASHLEGLRVETEDADFPTPLLDALDSDMTEWHSQRLKDIGPRAVDTHRLKVLVAENRRKGYNRTIPDELLDALASDGQHLVVPLLFHYFIQGESAPEHVRCQVYLKLRLQKEPKLVLFDIDEKRLLRLRPARKERKARPDPLWQEVLQIQADLIEQVKRNPPAIGLNAGHVPTGVPSYLQAYAHQEQGTGDQIAPLPLSAVNPHDPYFMNEDAITLTEFASVTMASHALGRDDLITPTGFLILERPFFTDVPTFGEVPIRGFTWRPTEIGVAIVAFFDLWHPDAPAHDIDAASLASYRARLWPAMHWEWPWGEPVDAVLGWQNAKDEDRDALLELRKFMMSFWLLSQQRVTLVSGQKPVRGLRRHAERMGMPTTVLVVTLRRAAPRGQYEGPGEPQHIEYSHRFIVSGHWRHLQRDEGIKLSWVTPYIKGPEDKPLIVKDKFYKFVR